MSAHKHAEIIKAKADNMDLSLFGNAIGGEWRECTLADLTIATGFYDFFLCLPQHKETCLHWLNGGGCQLRFEDSWGAGAVTKEEIGDWRDNLIWMKDQEIRIKPRKEKRWIAVNNSGYATPMTFISKQECENYVSVSYQKCPGVTWQHIEIEVEV